MMLTTISTGSLLYIYPASASPQNNQHIPYAYYLNHGTLTTPSNTTSYYPDTLPWQAPHVHTNTLPEFTSSIHLSQSLDTPYWYEGRSGNNQQMRSKIQGEGLWTLQFGL